MPLQYTDHQTRAALENEFRALWRKVDNLHEKVTVITETPEPPVVDPPTGGDDVVYTTVSDLKLQQFNDHINVSGIDYNQELRSYIYRVGVPNGELVTVRRVWLNVLTFAADPIDFKLHWRPVTRINRLTTTPLSTPPRTPYIESQICTFRDVSQTGLYLMEPEPGAKYNPSIFARSDAWFFDVSNDRNTLGFPILPAVAGDAYWTPTMELFLKRRVERGFPNCIQFLMQIEYVLTPRYEWGTECNFL